MSAIDIDPEIRYQNALQAYFGWLGASIGDVLDIIGSTPNIYDLIQETDGDLTLCFRGYREEQYLRRVFAEYEAARNNYVDSIVSNDPRILELDREIEDFSVQHPHYLLDERDILFDMLSEEARANERYHMTEELLRLFNLA